MKKKYEYFEKQVPLKYYKYIGKNRIKISMDKIEKEYKDIVKSYLNIKFFEILDNVEKFDRQLAIQYLNLERDRLFVELQNKIKLDNRLDIFLHEEKNIVSLETAIDNYVNQKKIDNNGVVKYNTNSYYKTYKKHLLKYFINDNRPLLKQKENRSEICL